METMEVHKVLRPFRHEKIHQSHPVTEKGPSHGINRSCCASWRGGHVPKFAMRQQRTDVSPKYKETQRELRYYFSGVSQRRIERKLWKLPEHIAQLKPYYAFERIEVTSLIEREGQVQNWVRRRSYLCEAHGLNTWGQLLHLMKNWRKFTIIRTTSCSSLSRVLSIRSSCSTSFAFPTSWSQDFDNLLCVLQHAWTSTTRLVTNPVTGRRTSTGKSVTAWIAVRTDRTGKELSLTHLKDQNCEMLEVQHNLDSNTSRAQSLNWVLWIGTQSSTRNRGPKFGSIKIRDETKHLAPTWNHFLEFGISLWSWPWNYWKV